MLISASLSNMSSTTSSRILLNPAKGVSTETGTPSTATHAGKSSTTASSGSSGSNAASRTDTHGKSSGGASASATASAECLVGSYSATVAGTQYSGSVEKSGAEYVASVPALSGATASGSSEIAAENSLTSRIDEIV